ncbi:hypothetical protein LTR85_000199 [Meristemomyces frigidus]|nr:hypothetical protein LTR85_000199 [Meristemomyces frigidus]
MLPVGMGCRIDADINPGEKWRPEARQKHIGHPSQQTYTVSHNFRVPRLPPQSASAEPLTMDQQIQLATSQAAGFTEGHEYEIGLGSQMDSVSWAQMGSKEQVFAEGPRPRRQGGMPKLKLVLVNRATFRVVA